MKASERQTVDVEELKERYKLLPFWARLVTAVLLGTAPAIYVYLDEGHVLVEELDQAKMSESAARAKFESSSRKKKNLPALENDLITAEEQLVKARKHLPDSYRVEDVLQKTATIAKEVGIRMQLFDPTGESPGDGDYKYMELLITTEVEGKFAQLAAFFDRMAHLESSIFVRNIDLTAALPDDKQEMSQKTPYEKAKQSRQQLYVKGRFDLVVYRAMTEEEMALANLQEPQGLGNDVGKKNMQAPKTSPQEGDVETGPTSSSSSSIDSTDSGGAA